MSDSLDVKKLRLEDPRVTSREGKPDAVDLQLEVWARELPDLDLDVEGIVERIHKLDRYLHTMTEETLHGFELSFGEWKLMGHLRYQGPPYRAKPGKLGGWLGLSSGAMTNRLDNLERRGLVRRLDDPDDRRGVLVELTDDGRALWGETVDVQARKEHLVASGLSDRDKHRLNGLLRRLLHAAEAQRRPPSPEASSELSPDRPGTSDAG